MESKNEAVTTNKSTSAAPKLLDQVRGKIRLKHYSLRTDQSCTDWIKRFIRHFDKANHQARGAIDRPRYCPNETALAAKSRRW
ncbi:MAG: hypothetical protein Q7T00_02495 [Rugosibacter sp.]|nr:hypothetical protein [Rugosibacter sp.]